MSKELIFPKRTIHLDFHTGTWVDGIGSKFDAEEFAQTYKQAHVDSVTLFAMGHHGHLYYDTKHPARHPGLPADMHLLEEQIEALHGVGIRAPIYLSVQCNEYAANEHPDWIALTPELKHVKRGNSAFEAGWQILDMSSPYQDFLADILDEVLRKFAPVDGIFMDMCWDQISATKWAIDRMHKLGYNPKDEQDRHIYARRVVHEYMERYRNMVEEAQKNHEPAGIWFNSRPKTNLAVEKKFLRHIEIEALPTGGWGYSYFPYVSRFVKPINLPTLSHTGRFFKSWGDNCSLKPEMALKYECCQILSMGMTNGIGDLLHPTGQPSKAVYDLIGSVYSHIEKCEPYIEDAEIVSQIAVVMDPDLGDKPGSSGVGITRALQQLRQQFDVIPPTASLEGYELVIIPETTVIKGEFKQNLEAYIADSGSVMISHRAALCCGEPVMDELGIVNLGESQYSHTFIHSGEKMNKDIPDYGLVMYDRGYMFKPAVGAEILAVIGEPYFERDYNHFSGHSYTPEEKLSDYAAIIRKGNVITFAVPIFEAYGSHAQPIYRTMIGNCIDILIPEPIIKDEAPSYLETTVMDTDDKRVVHLLSFCPERRADGLDIVEDAVPIVNVPMSIKYDKKPTRVYLAPNECDLEFDYNDGYVNIKVTMLDGHAMIIVE